MQTNIPPENNEAFSRLLREWSVEASLPPRFRENVWARIATKETQPVFNSWAGLSRWIETVLPRPRIAMAYVTVLLLAGVAAGFWQAQAETNRTDAALSSRYVQSVDPYRAVGLNP